MKLLVEQINDLEILKEGEDGKHSYVIRGIFLQGNMKNRNQRIYPTDMLAQKVENYNRDYVSKGRAWGELGHPPAPAIQPERTSHIIKSLVQEGDNFIGTAKVIAKGYGEIVRAMLDEGATVSASSRGVGSVKEDNGTNIVQEDYHLVTAADIVHDPSGQNCILQAVMEQAEWIYENGIFKQKTLDEVKTAIKQTPSRNMEKVLKEQFAKLMSDIQKNSL